MNGLTKNIIGQAPGSADIGVVCAVPDEFSGIWTLRHQLLTRLSARFWTVWLEPPAYWHTDGVSLRRPRFQNDEPYTKLLRFSNGYLAKVYRPVLLGRILDRRRLTLARTALREKGCRKFVLYVWRPQFAHYLELHDWDLTIYHIDDEYSFSAQESPISEQERSLLQSAGKVFIHSPALMEKKGRINSNTLWIPNGVDYNEFSKSSPEPSDLSRIPPPRIGYVGVLKAQLNLDLLSVLADARPEWSFVLVGPRSALGDREAALNALSSRPNVYEMGGKAPSALPSYVQHMDVAMMCYHVDDYTKYIYPLKLHEYLATGIPVVSSPIRSVLDFGDVVTLANGSDEWLTAIENAMSESANSASARNKRKAIAAQFDWSGLVERITDAICEEVV